MSAFLVCRFMTTHNPASHKYNLHAFSSGRFSQQILNKHYGPQLKARYLIDSDWHFESRPNFLRFRALNLHTHYPPCRMPEYCDVTAFIYFLEPPQSLLDVLNENTTNEHTRTLRLLPRLSPDFP